MVFNEKNIAFNLRMRRREKHMTQIELAEVADLSANAISKWESGFIFPESKTLCRLCQALECTPNDLFGREEEK